MRTETAMIYLWAFLGLLLTLLLLRGKNIRPHNLLWAVIPIDGYGPSLLGITIKPIYIVSFILVFFALIRHEFRLKLTKSMFLSTSLFGILITLSLLLRGNGNIASDLRIYTFFFIAVISATASLSLIEDKDDIRQIQEVFIASSVGFGLVCIILYLFYSVGLQLPAVVSDYYDHESSIFVVYKTMYNRVLSSSLRLRGFCVEANSANISFIIGLSSVLGKSVKEGFRIKHLLFSAVILFNIFLTQSRSALLIAAAVCFIYLFRFIWTKDLSRKRFILSVFGSLLVVAILSVLTAQFSLFDKLYSLLPSGLTSRSSPNDTYGRFSLWKESLHLLFDGNLLSGVGMGNLPLLSSLEKDAHNTLLEVLCSSGLLVGIYYIFYMMVPPFYALKYVLTNKAVDSDTTFEISTLIISYVGSALLLLTISNVVSLYFIYMSTLFHIIPAHLIEASDQQSFLSPNDPEIKRSSS